jgi:hypothetical protein
VLSGKNILNETKNHNPPPPLIGTLADIKGNINSQIYIDVLENNLWPVIARHFADNEYIFKMITYLYIVRVCVFFSKKNILIPNVAEKIILILVEEKKNMIQSFCHIT